MPDFCTTSVPGYAWLRAQRQYLARAREAIEMTGPRLHHLSARGRSLAWLQAAFTALRSAWDSCRSITSEDHPHPCSIVDAMPRNPCAVITVRVIPRTTQCSVDGVLAYRFAVRSFGRKHPRAVPSWRLQFSQDVHDLGRKGNDVHDPAFHLRRRDAPLGGVEVDLALLGAPKLARSREQHG